mmetsp:Transcript_69482/g.144902  ORF Transcript_69482/g.144902 Transcript_69482/m.144902 type:complete len:221 (+) Transcript_69482:317-979(+)
MVQPQATPPNPFLPTLQRIPVVNGSNELGHHCLLVLPLDRHDDPSVQGLKLGCDIWRKGNNLYICMCVIELVPGAVVPNQEDLALAVPPSCGHKDVVKPPLTDLCIHPRVGLVGVLDPSLVSLAKVLENSRLPCFTNHQRRNPDRACGVCAEDQRHPVFCLQSLATTEAADVCLPGLHLCFCDKRAVWEQTEQEPCLVHVEDILQLVLPCLDSQFVDSLL